MPHLQQKTANELTSDHHSKPCLQIAIPDRLDKNDVKWYTKLCEDCRRTLAVCLTPVYCAFFLTWCNIRGTFSNRSSQFLCFATIWLRLSEILKRWKIFSVWPIFLLVRASSYLATRICISVKDLIDDPSAFPSFILFRANSVRKTTN